MHSFSILSDNFSFGDQFQYGFPFDLELHPRIDNTKEPVDVVLPDAKPKIECPEDVSQGANSAISQNPNDELPTSERKIIKSKHNSSYVDVTPYLIFPQNQAAAKIGIPSSTLSKRWKEATMNRKWPYRTVAKLDKEILTLLRNMSGCSIAPIALAATESQISTLLKKRNEELRTVLIRLA